MNLENKLMKMQSTRIALKPTQKENYTLYIYVRQSTHRSKSSFMHSLSNK